MVGIWHIIPFWIPTIVEVVIFGLGAIAAVVRAAYRDFIDEIDSKNGPKKQFVQDLRAQIESITL